MYLKCTATLIVCQVVAMLKSKCQIKRSAVVPNIHKKIKCSYIIFTVHVYRKNNVKSSHKVKVTDNSKNHWFLVTFSIKGVVLKG